MVVRFVEFDGVLRQRCAGDATAEQIDIQFEDIGVNRNDVAGGRRERLESQGSLRGRRVRRGRPQP